ncbi:MAG: polysaccharide biosynthesis tyrosine autokinase [Cellulophaga sp.]
MQNSTIPESIDLKEIIASYTKHWKWFVLSVFAFLTIAFLILRYAIPEYAAKAKIQILEDDSSASGFSNMFKEMDFFSGGNVKVEDEIEIITSRLNFIDVVKELHLNTRIMVVGSVVSSEVYKRTPIKLNFIATDSIINSAKYSFYVTLSSSTTFGFSEEEDGLEKVYTFGKNIVSPIGGIIITPDVLNFKKFQGKKIKISIFPVNDVAQKYRRKINVSLAEKNSSIIDLYLEDPIKEKAKDILRVLVRIYNKNAIDDKKAIADRTSQFINDRIAEISSSLSSVDQSAQDFKTGRGVTDIANEASLNLNVGAANQRELTSMRTQLEIVSSMKGIVEEQEGYEHLPANLGISDPTIAATTAKYNELISQRKRLLKSSNEKNPIVVALDQQINSLKNNVYSSLSSTVNNLGLQVNTLSGQQAIINSKIYSAPKNARALRDITRKQETTEQLYLYLLQKREESQIGVASTSPKSKIIDEAYIPSKFPVSPKRNMTYLAFLILGFLCPFSIIYVQDLLDNKVSNMYSLEKLTKNTPVLGELPKLLKKEEKMVLGEDRSVLSEALRIIRTNLDYLIKTKVESGNKNNIIFVTSSVPGEGKTFLSSNLSMILASTNKKVLLIGADIRNPKIYSFFSGDQIDKMKRPSRNKDAGLTEFLFSDTIGVKDIINPMLVHTNTIDVIYSGKIPPNPAELLMSNRLEGLFKEVSEMYDYVIVDTAPMMVVTDTLLLSQYANHLIYVTRAGVTDEKAIEFPLKLREEGKIKGLCYIVNDVKTSNLGYGGKYGYGYGKSLKKWWKFS